MKIIGRNRDGLIVEATDHELARIMGHDQPPQPNESGCTTAPVEPYSHRTRFKDSAVIHVNDMWDWMTEARKAIAKMHECANIARAAASILDRAPPESLTNPTNEK